MNSLYIYESVALLLVVTEVEHRIESPVANHSGAFSVPSLLSPAFKLRGSLNNFNGTLKRVFTQI